MYEGINQKPIAPATQACPVFVQVFGEWNDLLPLLSVSKLGF